MPTYDYECQKCGKVFEVFHGMSEAGPKTCSNPKCKGKVKKLVGAGAGLIFKGSGFYITDYKKKGKGSDSSESSSSSSSSSSSTSTTTPAAKTESTPAVKPESTKAKSSSAKKGSAKD